MKHVDLVRATVLVLLSAAAGQAEQRSLVCRFAGSEFIAQQVVLRHDAGSGNTMVDDDMIRRHAGNPRKARVEDFRNGRNVYDWRVQGIAGTSLFGGALILDYTLRVEPDGRASIEAISPYNERFAQRGQCS